MDQERFVLRSIDAQKSATLPKTRQGLLTREFIQVLNGQKDIGDWTLTVFMH